MMARPNDFVDWDVLEKESEEKLNICKELSIVRAHPEYGLHT